MILVLWGEDKSTKNTLALTAPKPLVDMELDIGGFRRSCRNIPGIPIKDWYDQKLITVEQYIMPFQFTEQDLAQVRSNKIVIGMKELWYQFAGAFIKHLKDPNIKTIMVDTGTILNDLTNNAYLQELQEKQLPLRSDGMGSDGKQLRSKLQRQEYTEPNNRMRAFAYQAKAAGKNLVVTHHATDEYGMVKIKGEMTIDRTGKRIMHGWKRWGDSADVIGRIVWDAARSVPVFNIELAEVKEIEGMALDNPTFDMIDNLIKSIRGD